MHRITGKLLLNKLVVRCVIVKRLDQVVAIVPGIFPQRVAFETIGLGITNNVDPVLRPAFAKMGTCQHTVNQACPGIGMLIVHEGVNLFGRGRQPQDNQVEAANEHLARGLRRKFESLLLETCVDKRIDGVGGPVVCHRDRCPLDRTE